MQACAAGVLVYVIGVPLGTFISIHRSRLKNKLGDVRVRKKFGMLYDGYQEKWCWWEGGRAVSPTTLLVTCVVFDAQ